MCFIPRILLRTDGLIIKKAIEDDRSVSIGGTAFGICRVLFDMTETRIGERPKNAPAATAGLASDLGPEIEPGTLRAPPVMIGWLAGLT